MPRKTLRISLANKCQLLFGAAVVLILTAALTVGWVRMQDLALEGHQETARELAKAWLADMIQLGEAIRSYQDKDLKPGTRRGLRIALLEKEHFSANSQDDPFLANAIQQFAALTNRTDVFGPATDESGQRYFRYARAIRRSDLQRPPQDDSAEMATAVGSGSITNPLEMVLVVELPADVAERRMTLNLIYIVAAGLFASLLAIGVFWFITTRIILKPVRVLRDVAEKVSEGNLNIRSDINTGDEFEQLSDTFNTMLSNLKSHEDQLRATAKSLDLKLGELAEHNVALYDANKIKGEFLANVSHELRTPLHSIIGFAEVLQETLRERTGPVDEKRKRYAANIIASSKRLLDLINDLLDLAKIEAGRIDLHLGPLSIEDTAEGLMNLIRPQAEKRAIQLELKIQPNIPLVQTDAGRFQQIIFNFLSNALKFTPDGGTITLAAVLHNDPFGPDANAGRPIEPNASTESLPPPPESRVRVSVSDTGPGIAPEDQHLIFEKFTQLDPSVTKEQGGTGLGLTISRDLAKLLQGEITLDTELGTGTTFSLIIPLAMESTSTPLMPELVAPQRSGTIVSATSDLSAEPSQ